jgi:hypothetical protein
MSRNAATRPGHRRITEPYSPSSHRLHNSGPGVREVFRCSPIGTEVRLDLYSAICRCDALSGGQLQGLRQGLRLEEPPTGPAGGRGTAALARIPESSIAAIGAAALEVLGEPLAPPLDGSDADRARPVLRAVTGLVMARGWHTDRLGLARHIVVGRESWNAQQRLGSDPISAEELAFTLAAFAVYTPPLLLWSRNPTTDWLRVDVYLQLRALWGAGGAR